MKWIGILLPLLLALLYVGLVWLFDLHGKNIIHAIVLFAIIIVGNIFIRRTNKNKKKIV